MRIAFIVSHFPSLSQTFVLNQVVGLIEQGHSVDIYAETASETDTKLHHDVVKYKLLDHTYYFNRPKQRIAEVTKGGCIVFLETIKSFRFLQRVLEYTRWDKEDALFSRLKFIYLAKEFMNKPEYDVIHCHFGPNGSKGTVVKKMFYPDSLLATTFHGYDLTKYLSSGKNPYRQLFESGDLFLPISEHWKKHLIELGCSPEKIQTHHMGVNVERFAVSTPVDNKKRLKLITIARLSEKKGIEYGIRAVHQLKKSHLDADDIEYSIVGEGPLRPNLQVLIEELDLTQTVKLLGWRQQQEIVELLGQSQILLAPSITAADGDQEGIPVVLMEAMAMGIPVVSTLHSGIPELVKDGSSGFLVPERDVKIMAEKLALLANSSTLRTEMGLAGRKYVEDNFNVHKLNYRLSELFKQTSAQKASG